MRYIKRITRRRGAAHRGVARLGYAAATLMLAVAGLVTIGAAPAYAVVPAGCGAYSGANPPGGFVVVDMAALGINFYNSAGGPEFVIGTSNADVITMTGADDIVCGLAGADFIDTGGGEDEAYGGDGADEVYGGLGDDFISGGKGGDDLTGDTFAPAGAAGGDDRMQGGDGDDDIDGDGGVDTGIGGSGSNTCTASVENQTNC
jgi:hypothetical protein